jgi:hypothetical protein
MIGVDISALLTSAVIGAFVAGLRDDPGVVDGYLQLSVNNSHIVIRTKRIDRLVAIGPPALGPLIREMRKKDSSLDTFARCYSACDQILGKAGLKDRVRARVLMVGQTWSREMLFHIGDGAFIGTCAGTILGGIIRASLKNNILGDSVGLVIAMALGFVFTAVVVLVLQLCAAA